VGDRSHSRGQSLGVVCLYLVVQKKKFSSRSGSVSWCGIIGPDGAVDAWRGVLCLSESSRGYERSRSLLVSAIKSVLYLVSQRVS
jgi:hypothetical protein